MPLSSHAAFPSRQFSQETAWGDGFFLFFRAIYESGLCSMLSRPGASPAFYNICIYLASWV